MTNDIIDQIERGLYAALTGYSPGTAFYAMRVYEGMADENDPDFALPFVRFIHIAGGDDNSHPAESFNVIYQIECWGLTRADARTGASHIRAALTHKPITLAGGLVNTWIAPEMFIRTKELVEGKQYFRAGYRFRLRIS